MSKSSVFNEESDGGVKENKRVVGVEEVRERAT